MWINMTLVQALQNELRELETQLRADPRYRRITKIRDLLNEYDPKSVQLGLQFTADPGATTGYIVDLSDPKPLTGSKGERVKATVTAMLKAAGSVHRKTLLSALEAKGLMGKEKDPMRALAIYLSSWRDEFASDGAGNYSLKSQPPAS
jgi:hypothetical protein